MTTKMKTVVGMLAGVVGTVAAVAAQQPTAPSSPAAVIEALKRPTAPADTAPNNTTEDEASIAAVLARYEKMITAGEAASASPAPVPAARPPRSTVSTPAAVAAAAPTADDTLDAIRADLQAIVGRLDGLARKGGQ